MNPIALEVFFFFFFGRDDESGDELQQLQHRLWHDWQQARDAVKKKKKQSLNIYFITSLGIIFS